MADDSAGGLATRAAAAADDAFGADLYRVLDAGGGNTVFSPASVAGALRLALCGAAGRTAAEIAAALHLSGPEAAGEGLGLLPGGPAGPGGGRGDGDPTVRAPNTMWVQAGLPLRPGFTGQLRDAAAVTVRQADFRGAAEAVRAEINQLIADQTAGKITGLLAAGSVSAQTRLLLASAVYLKAAWAHPFPVQATADAPFYPDGDGSGPVLTVPTMRNTTRLPYTRGPGYQAVLLPYRASRLAMAVVLPDGPLADLVPALSGGDGGQDGGGGLTGLLGDMNQYQVTLALPRFRQRSGFGLVPALRRLGVRDAFTDQADFSGITAADRLMVGGVVHQGYIDVDEHGTEAAAATAVTMQPMALRRAEPVTMTVDRPFLFGIVDRASGLPLFLGHVVRPGAG